MGDGSPRRVSSRQRKATEKALTVFDENILEEATPNPRRSTGGITKEEMQQAVKQAVGQAVGQAMAEANAEWAKIVTTMKIQIDEAFKRSQEYVMTRMDQQQAQIQMLTERVNELYAREEGRSNQTSSPTWATTAASTAAGNVDIRAVGSLPRCSESASLFCTVDTSRTDKSQITETTTGKIRERIEAAVQQERKDATWKCKAVYKVHNQEGRCRIFCRNEKELEQVKQAAEKTMLNGGRVLRDQLYPIKVDGACARHVITPDGKIREDARTELEAENNVQIGKIVWLSGRHSGKEYGSMAIFVTRGEDAVRLLREGFFNVGGESGSVQVFEARKGPLRCYNCHEVGHRAFQCKNEVKCGKCAEKGHARDACTQTVPKCATCGGPHEVSSRNCPSHA